MNSSSSAPLRFAVVGARRGRSFIKSAKHFGQVELVAVCDTNPEALAEWKDEDSIRCYSDYEQLLNDDSVDAVCIATPVPLHAKQSIAALEAGKHVLSEVTAVFTIEEGWDLIAAVERTGLTYMMAENYCYMRDVLMVQNMVDQGVFGELTYATGSYIHDCRDLLFTPEGELTWRGRLRQDAYGNCYPTHSLGPVSRWLGINRDDFYQTTATWQSKSRAVEHYAKRNLPEHPQWSDTSQWKMPDTVTTLLRTEQGVLVESRFDFASARPHHMTRYELQGTKASFASQTDPHNKPLIWIEGRSPANETGVAKSWEPLYQYADEFEHPLWREHLEEAEKAGHGGGDFFVLREFAGAIAEGRPPMIDVYDAVTWSAITPLSMQSADGGGIPVEVPRFAKSRP